MPELPTPTVTAGEPFFTQLRQVTIHADEEMACVNQLLAEGWRLVSVGYRPDAVVYVLGRADEKPRHRAGFLGPE